MLGTFPQGEGSRNCPSETSRFHFLPTVRKHQEPSPIGEWCQSRKRLMDEAPDGQFLQGSPFGGAGTRQRDGEGCCDIAILPSPSCRSATIHLSPRARQGNKQTEASSTRLWPFPPFPQGEGFKQHPLETPSYQRLASEPAVPLSPEGGFKLVSIRRNKHCLSFPVANNFDLLLG